MGVNSFVIEGMKLKKMCKSMDDCVRNCPFFDHNAPNPDLKGTPGVCMFAAMKMGEPTKWNFYFTQET